jgi:ZIP family zinc transporter
MVELIAAFVGVLIVQQIQNLLPYALAFAAGAMTYVVVEELIPESQLDNQTHISTFGLIFGFIIMMILDIALG